MPSDDLANRPLSQPAGESAPDVRPIPPQMPFNRHLLFRVQSFTCAAPHADHEERWEADVSKWIKAKPQEPGAVYALENENTRVWIYPDENGEIIGYASLGPQKLLVGEKHVILPTIPYFGIVTKFQGKPEGPNKACRYARRIFQGLIDEAQRLKLPFLFLYVDPDNTRALEKFYPDFGFRVFSRETDEFDGRTWIVMHKEFSSVSAPSP